MRKKKEQAPVNRGASWTAKILSYAGRLQLMKSVVSGILNYQCQIFILPKKGDKGCWKEMLCFFTEGQQWEINRSKSSLVSALFSQVWRWLGSQELIPLAFCLYTKKTDIYCINHAHYGLITWLNNNLLNGSCLLQVSAKSDSTHARRKLLDLRNFSKPHVKHIAGNGKTISLWYDNWRPYEASPKNHCDSALGDKAWVTDVIIVEIQSALCSTLQPNVNSPDRVVYTGSSNGFWGFVEAWKLLSKSGRKVIQYWLFWFKPNVPKFTFISWLIMQNRLSTFW